MSVVVKHEKEQLFITKGAVIPILKVCSKINLNGRVKRDFKLQGKNRKKVL